MAGVKRTQGWSSFASGDLERASHGEVAPPREGEVASEAIECDTVPGEVYRSCVSAVKFTRWFDLSLGEAHCSEAHLRIERSWLNQAHGREGEWRVVGAGCRRAPGAPFIGVREGVANWLQRAGTTAWPRWDVTMREVGGVV